MNLRNTVMRIVRETLAYYRYKHCKTAKKFLKQHKCPALTREEKAEIDRYWADYHVKLDTYDWHRMFYAVTGIRDPRFIPQPFAEQVLYRYYKNMGFSAAYADKNMFASFLPEARFPKAFGKRMHFHYYDAEDRYCGDKLNDTFVDRVWDAIREAGGGNEIILKETVASSFGKGVKKATVESKEALQKLLSGYKLENFAIQEVVRQHPFFAQLNPDSVNIIRITTWRKGDRVYPLAPCIRFGIKGSHTDVAFVDGKEILNVVKIGEDGRIAEQYVTLEGEHVDFPAGIDRQVPQWEEILKTVEAGALRLRHFDIVAWDVTVDDQGRVVCIEYNLNFPGSLIYQFAHGPLAGDHTDELLAFLKDPKNKKYLPACIRAR